ncbi:transmembrane 4 L6 family member 5 [Poeciliopsis prolifica]|uniref:transmembrane 4 L6 family member 5 n=1 Tax=Poeciliopsis prolifica TaxID=188132 RepID=UPI00072CB3AB|nr:transmembrane 4 L6 family member 5 [Poeciliopsis prolifica]
MCTGKCSKVIAIPLYVLALLSVICNIMLFFPDFTTEYASADSESEPKLTDEVKYMGGFIGGGIMILIPAIHIHLTSTKGCCANRCGMFLSIGFAALGVAGAIYSLAVAAVGLQNGPVCRYVADNGAEVWGRPFLNTSGNYLGHKDTWDRCLKPENVVEFNLGLFSTLLVAASLEAVLCAFQMINGLFGCICGTCSNKDED